MSYLADNRKDIPVTLGLAVAAIGLAHFAFPAPFDFVNRLGSPKRTRLFTYVNGGIETTIGVTLAVNRTRKIAPVIGCMYACYLAANVIRVRVSGAR